MEIPKDVLHFKPELFEEVRVNVWKCFLKQYQEKKMCDVMIVCGSQTFYSHRCILSAISPYFKLVFSSEYSHNKDNGYLVSDLSNFPQNCVHFLLDFVYQKPDIDTTLLDILEFLKLLDYLQIKGLYPLIEEVSRPNIDVSNCFKVLEIADICRISKLFKVTLAFITSNIKEIIAVVDFSVVSEHVIMLCLHSEIFHFVPATDVMLLITKWVHAKHEERDSMQKSIRQELHCGWQMTNVKREITETQLDVVLHYSTNGLDGLAMVNSVENRRLENWSVLRIITFLQDRYNHLKVLSYKLSFFDNVLYIAAVVGEDSEKILVFAKFHQEKGVYDVKANILCNQYGKCDVHKGDYLVDVIEVVGIHIHNKVLYVAVTMWCCESCYVFQFDIHTNYCQMEDPILIPVKDDMEFDFTAYENLIFVRDNLDGYCYDLENKTLKHLTLEDDHMTLDFFNGKIIGIHHYPEDGIIEFYELNLADGSWKHALTLSLPKVTLEHLDATLLDGYYYARHFIHNNMYFIQLPPEPGTAHTESKYRNVDFESNCLGTYEIRLDIVDFSRDFISLPSWILL